jgi:hypothetical protein
MADVFISYQRTERDAVAIVAEKLSALKLEVWFDSMLKTGGTFDEQIATKLRDAKAVLVCWTPSAMESQWVRGEAALANNKNKLVPCFLAPTELIPPFNLTQTEDLTTWAGQEDAPPWLNLLKRIGELVGRPGLAAYTDLFSPKTTLTALRAWANANGDDPLVNDVWARISLLEGEGSAERIAREKVEARELHRRRKEQAARSRDLAKARGIRAGRILPLRFVALSVLILLVALFSVVYVFDNQRRERLLNAAQTPDEVRAFIAKNNWHPIAKAGRQKLIGLDDAAWETARGSGSVEAFDAYLAAFPSGAHHRDAEQAKVKAESVRKVQSMLARLGRYAGAPHGALDAATREAIKAFQFERGVVVTGTIDDALINRLATEIDRFTKVNPDELVAKRTGPPTLEEYRDIAARLAVDAPTLEALRQVESIKNGFDAKGHPTIIFERHIFSRLTQRRFDASHPEVSARQPGYDDLSMQWTRLKQAYALDPDAAYKSTSFGMFQITGFNHKLVGFETAAELARFISLSEANQVEIFARWVERQGVLQPLQCLDWTGFARRYNGPSQANQYAEKLRAAYVAAAARYGIEAPSLRPGCK